VAYPSRMAYDLIGDVHGCRDELVELLRRLGYSVEGDSVRAPQGRTAILLGDLVNKGPDVPGVLRLAMAAVADGAALAVPGNHDLVLTDHLRGIEFEYPEELAESLTQLGAEPASFSEEVIEFFDALPRRLTLDGGRLVVAHAGLPEEYHGSESEEADRFAVFGRRVPDADGRMVRYRWAADYRGEPLVVFGHYATPDAEWLNNTVCIDTGCIYGGRLTALRYPELELVSVAAAQVYSETERSSEFRAAALGGADSSR
jgi:protein phosphatase